MEHQIPNNTFYMKKEVEGLGPLAIHDLLFKPEMVQDEVGNMTAKENSCVCKICESQAILSGSPSPGRCQVSSASRELYTII